MKNNTAIIVEDESAATHNLKYILADVAPSIQVVATLESVEETVDWLQTHPAPSLGFFDIQLEDGLSFEIFRKTAIEFPVIFTTAFNAYALEAFKVNSIDYLLKPIQVDELKFSLDKFQRLTQKKVEADVITSLLHSLAGPQETSTFLIHYKDKLIPVAVKDFAFFYIENELVHGCTHKNQTYVLTYTFDELESKLNARQFFRANRQYLVNRSAIQEIELFFNHRLALKLVPAPKEAVLVSKARVPVFKKWMES